MDKLKEKFKKIGARVKTSDLSERNRWNIFDASNTFLIDVNKDKRGEFFSIQTEVSPENVRVLDCKPADRHLLLLVELEGEKHRFLCGHDERQWYTCAIPDGNRPASTVEGAKESLKPIPVKQAQAGKHLKKNKRNKRKNAAFIRQGEWFFIPEPDADPGNAPILRKEPLSRGRGSKPHVVDEAFRFGGTLVYVDTSGNVFTESERKDFLRKNPGTQPSQFRVMRRDPVVYVRGRVRHPDHKTINLVGWHRVHMNTEASAPAAAVRSVVFLD